MAPPVIAIILAWRRGWDGRARMDATWVTIVAALNIVVSLVLIVRFGHEVVSALDLWRRFWQPRPAAGDPRLTPI